MFFVVSCVVTSHVEQEPSELQLLPLTVPRIVSPTESAVPGALYASLPLIQQCSASSVQTPLL